MKIHEISINRPVAILMCVMIVLVLGVVSLTHISVALIPDIEFPMAIVSTTYSGVGPQEIESIVTKPIENAVATVNNVKTIQSQSSEGNSMVMVEFNSGTDMDFAALQMREKIDMFKGMLPDDVSNPMVIKADPSMMPVVSMGVEGKSNEVELKTFIEDRIKPRLESLDGVASISVTGGKTREIRVELDPQKMAGYGITFNHISSALQTENLNLPGGSVEYGDKNLLIRTTGQFKSVEQIKNIPMTLSTGNIIYIRDVAEVKDDYQEVTSYTRMNGKDSISISVQKQTDANTLNVVNLVKEEMIKIQDEHSDIHMDLIFDQGEYIEKAIGNVAQSAILGGIFAVIVLFIFLKNIRTTFIIATSIPISVITTFIAVYFSGITINMISLGGLALGVGMLVDNSVVVLENIYRHRNEGYSRIEAAKLGTQEVGGAVMASTLTTVAVFLPIVFVQGMAGQIFKELALTVAFSLGASLLVSLTLIPMLSSKFLKMVKPHEASRAKTLNKVFDKWDDMLNGLDHFYRKVLQWVLGHRKTTAVTVAAIFILSLCAFPLIGMEYMPKTDQGQFSVNIELAQGVLLEETNKITQQVEKILMDIPELEKAFVNVATSGRGISLGDESSNTASITGTLVSLNQRQRSTAQIVDEIRQKVKAIPGADITVSEASSSMGGGMGSSSPISIKISGPDMQKLEEISTQVVELVSSVEGTRQVESSIAEGRPEAQIYVNRDKASYYGLGTSQVASAIRTTITGQVATTYKVGGDEIDIRVQVPKEKRKDFQQLKNIKIVTASGVEVSLTDIADVVLEEGPVAIGRENQQRYVSVTADIFGRDLGSVSRDIDGKLSGLSVPSEYAITSGGEQKEMMESFVSLIQALLLAVLLVYMVMAAQFESLLHPFTIMFSIPLAYTGSLLGLLITGRSLSVNGFIGVIMLAGIVVNNAIVLVDYVNTLRATGMERREAILKAGPTRLRPILMTTLTTILGLLPMALGIGEGAEMQAPMATVVIGGLITSTILTLVIIPVIYTLFDDIGMKIKNRRKNKKASQAAVV
ncbi:efflux RND transporter permease subunit [Petroclostridium sp. X23]|uniref:efflux RND transporter permease subunit n=1 Tax=Petroclostridium sp. X23 TaxID=3045146 RepID=UPI0024AD0653|nr:efflux RND transporter permease subunit [Petroclostridium sp. X23]WHH60872.1 efflux RND transporter permease subunit [Petroclostridium sp. X23]